LDLLLFAWVIILAFLVGYDFFELRKHLNPDDETGMKEKTEVEKRNRSDR
jgi:hypothetical protein